MWLGQAYSPPQPDHSCQFGTLSPYGDLRPLNEETDADTDAMAGAGFRASSMRVILSPKMIGTGLMRPRCRRF